MADGLHVCTHRLAEMRERRGLTQRQVAQAMGVTGGRVSQIENGELAGIDVLDRYVSALGWGSADRRQLRR